MRRTTDGPASPHFRALRLKGKAGLRAVPLHPGREGHRVGVELEGGLRGGRVAVTVEDEAGNPASCTADLTIDVDPYDLL